MEPLFDIEVSLTIHQQGVLKTVAMEAIIEFHCELWHVSPMDEVTVKLVTEFEPNSVIYNTEEYNRTYIRVLTIDGCCLFEVFG